MSTLYLLKYNNYFNRTIKYYDTLNDYLTNVTYYRKVDDINFNYNDNVNTTQTINWGGTPINEQECDYLLVDNGDYGLTRWFIIENVWNRKGQQLLTLRRDLVVDYFNDYINMPFFAEKGCINTYTSTTIPLISNSENILTSQILKGKSNITASSECIVGYIDRTFEGGKLVADADALYVDDITQLPFYKYLDTQVYIPATNPYYLTAQIASNAAVGASSGNNVRIRLTTSGAVTTGSSSVAWSNPTESRFYSTNIANAAGDLAAGLNATGCALQLYNRAYESFNIEGYSIIEENLGRPIMLNGKVFTLEVKQVGSTATQQEVDISGFSGSLRASVLQSTNMGDKWTASSFSDMEAADYFSLSANVTTFSPYLKEDSSASTITIPGIHSRTHCGRPYDIFYMPYSTTAYQIASLIAARYYSSGIVYDIQRLPYGPNLSSSDGSSTATYDGTTITIRWLHTDTASHTSSTPAKTYSTVLDAKVGALCDTWRVISPNNANAWDFNPA